jgi:hypothetical protein
MATFLDHLLSTDDLIADLDLHSLGSEDRQELLDLIDQIFHHHAMDTIFTHLPKSYHQEFISLLKVQAHNPDLLEYVKTKVTVDIETEIKKTADRVKIDLRDEIRKSKKKKR